MEKKKTFKDYYENEEFRKKQQEYLQKKVDCTCGKKIRRGNLARHQQTNMHFSKLKQNEKLEEIIIKKQKMEARIIKIQNDIESADRMIARLSKK